MHHSSILPVCFMEPSVQTRYNKFTLNVSSYYYVSTIILKLQYKGGFRGGGFRDAPSIYQECLQILLFGLNMYNGKHIWVPSINKFWRVLYRKSILQTFYTVTRCIHCNESDLKPTPPEMFWSSCTTILQHVYSLFGPAVLLIFMCFVKKVLGLYCHSWCK